jgi:hypothetical protein
MTDVVPEFETVDSKGTTDSYNGTVGTSLTAIPTVAGNIIQEACVICEPDQHINYYIDIYTDGGTNFIARIYSGGAWSSELKGGKTQIHIKGSAASVKYQINLDREDH